MLTQILGVQELLNLARMVLGSIWYRERVIAREFIGVDPLSHLIFPFGLDVAVAEMLPHARPVSSWTTSFQSSLIDVCLSFGALGQFFEDEKSSQTLSAEEAALVNGRVNSGSVELSKFNFEASVPIFGQSVLIRWRSSREIDGVSLSHVRCDSSRACPNLLAIISSTTAVDIESSQDLSDGFVDS